MQKSHWRWLQGMLDLCLVTGIMTGQPGHRAVRSGRIQPNCYTGVSFDGTARFLDPCICFVSFHSTNPSSPGTVIEMHSCKTQEDLMLWCKKFSLIHWGSLSSGPAGIWKSDRSWLCLLLGQRELSHCWLCSDRISVVIKRQDTLKPRSKVEGHRNLANADPSNK